ncbi:MAG: hypothetical protein L6Q29_03775 [Candidatus Pacebacteria bacterium]|nr:hypothetical protein [Candidatus Paceibacterota bacterium]NUQ57408.1 hypothetical protein [Candidatus Paceibacter sp.]
MALNILKIFGLSAFSFLIGMAVTPLLTHYLYKYKMWKKSVRTKTFSGDAAVITSELYKDKDVGTPRMGGVLIWGSALLITILFYGLSKLSPLELNQKLNFLSRNQTWIPIFGLIAGSLLGLADDLLVVFGKGKYNGGGISFSKRIGMVFIIGLAGALWFYYKLGMSGIHIPFVGEFVLGLFFIPFFIFVMVAIFTGGVIDGLDGLSGGIFAAIFAAYGGIAYFQNQLDLAAFCGIIMGGILAFLWFNIPPARFYMGETGILGLTTALVAVAFLTDTVVVLPIIAFPLIAASGSSIIQILSKRFFGRKVFLAAPIHHHFQAKGWPAYKVVMRFWIISVILAMAGMVVALWGKA